MRFTNIKRPTHEISIIVSFHLQTNPVQKIFIPNQLSSCQEFYNTYNYRLANLIQKIQTMPIQILILGEYDILINFYNEIKPNLVEIF